MLKGFVLRRKAADKSFVAKTPVRARVTTPVLDQIYILPQNDPLALQESMDSEVT